MAEARFRKGDEVFIHEGSHRGKTGTVAADAGEAAIDVRVGDRAASLRHGVR